MIKLLNWHWHVTMIIIVDSIHNFLEWHIEYSIFISIFVVLVLFSRKGISWFQYETLILTFLPLIYNMLWNSSSSLMIRSLILDYYSMHALHISNSSCGYYNNIIIILLIVALLECGFVNVGALSLGVIKVGLLAVSLECQPLLRERVASSGMVCVK